MLLGSCQGVVFLVAVKSTGGGRVAKVIDWLRFGATKTCPPPAPMAVTFGAAKGTNLADAGEIQALLNVLLSNILIVLTQCTRVDLVCIKGRDLVVR